MAIGTLDLGIITDHLIKKVLEICIDGEPITVTGNSPDIVQGTSTTSTISFYLFHASPNPHQRNSPVLGDIRERKRVPRLPYQPLSLDLYYLMSAYSEKKYAEEQKAMSIAMKCLYEHAIVKGVNLVAGGGQKAEYVLSMEVLSTDEIGRLWQSFTVANRFSVVYKVSVVFIEPGEDPTPVAKPPKILSLTLAPESALPSSVPSLLTSSRHVRYIGPDDVPTDPKKRNFHDYDMIPAVVAPSESFELIGSHLDRPNVTLALQRQGASDVIVTSWITAPDTTKHRLRLKVPSAPGVDPGGYSLQATVDGSSTNATPFSLAALVIPPESPPILDYIAPNPLAVRGFGFVPGKTEVYLETVELSENNAVGDGQFFVVTGEEIRFKPPVDLARGRYGLRVRVNGVESTPAAWVKMP